MRCNRPLSRAQHPGALAAAPEPVRLEKAAEKRLIYRILIFTGFFVLGMFWLILLAWYDYPIYR